MAGKIKQIWEALAECFKANEGPLTSAQVVAWIGVKYKERNFNPVTLKAQLYRSCGNVPWAQKYNTPKTLVYEQRTKTYSRLDQGNSFTTETPDPTEAEILQESSGFEEGLSQPEDQSDLLVGVEAQLRDYLAKNLSKLGEPLVFWIDSPPSVEYTISGRRIDILAKDTQGNPVVIELKREKAYDRVVGQALLYQALVSSRFNLSKVRVILVANEISNELHLACSRQADFKLFEYELTMQLNPVSTTISPEEEA